MPNSQGTPAEEARLLYVAMTRAIGLQSTLEWSYFLMSLIRRITAIGANVRLMTLASNAPAKDISSSMNAHLKLYELVFV